MSLPARCVLALHLLNVHLCFLLCDLEILHVLLALDIPPRWVRVFHDTFLLYSPVCHLQRIESEVTGQGMGNTRGTTGGY